MTSLAANSLGFRCYVRCSTHGFHAARLSAHPDLAEAQRDLLRRLGHEAEKDVGKKQEAVEEALRALGHEHPLVRLGGVHLLARVAGDWRPLRPLAGDEDLLVRLGVLRAVGRLAEQGDEEAESFLAEAARESDRNAARSESTRITWELLRAELRKIHENTFFLKKKA